jgi:hypothetical protein
MRRSTVSIGTARGRGPRAPTRTREDSPSPFATETLSRALIQKPFEFFELETDLVHPADVLVTRSQIRGLIAESVLADAPETGQRLDVFMHFDYFNDTPVVFGS